MQFDVFINFDGQCRDAVNFYAKVFKAEVKNLMTYGEAPPDPNYTILEADKDKIIYADVQIGNMTAMFMDMPAGMPLVLGNNIQPTISTTDKSEIEHMFNELKQGGEVNAQLEKTFFSDLYGMVTDKFGVSWQLLYQPEND